MSHEIVRLLEVKKYFGETRAVGGLSMAVKKGEVLGFLGLNGSGKTTTMRLLVGLIRAEEGEMNVLGEDPWELTPETRWRIGYLSEKDFPFPDMTLEHAVAFVSRFYPHWDEGYLEKLHVYPRRCELPRQVERSARRAGRTPSNEYDCRGPVRRSQTADRWPQRASTRVPTYGRHGGAREMAAQLSHKPIQRCR